MYSFIYNSILSKYVSKDIVDAGVPFANNCVISDDVDFNVGFITLYCGK